MLFEQAAVCFSHTFGQAVVEIGNGLSAVLIVLVTLNGNAGKRGIAGNVARLAQHAVAGGKAAAEQLAQVYLAAGGSKRVEVHIVNMDVAVGMRRCKFGRHYAHFVELLGRIRCRT